MLHSPLLAVARKSPSLAETILLEKYPPSSSSAKHRADLRWIKERKHWKQRLWSRSARILHLFEDFCSQLLNRLRGRVARDETLRQLQILYYAARVPVVPARTSPGVEKSSPTPSRRIRRVHQCCRPNPPVNAPLSGDTSTPASLPIW